MAERDITVERVRYQFTYDPDTGIFLHRHKARGIRRAIAGCTRSDGYVLLCMDRRMYLAHRVAWIYVYGVWPSKFIDHIDRNPSNNRILNLRDVGQSENMQNQTTARNNTTGVLGVHFNTKHQKYVASLMLGRKPVFCKYFASLEDAINARKDAERIFHKGKPI